MPATRRTAARRDIFWYFPQLVTFPSTGHFSPLGPRNFLPIGHIFFTNFTLRGLTLTLIEPRRRDSARSTVRRNRPSRGGYWPSIFSARVARHTVYASICFPRLWCCQQPPKFGHSHALLCMRIFFCYTKCIVDLADVSSGASLSRYNCFG